jgi:hypothetical protein
MRRVFNKASIMAVLATLTLSACSNNSSDLDSLDLVKGIFSQQRKIKPSDPQAVARSLTKALANSTGPLALLHLKKTGTTTVLRQIETNGAYVTWAAYGSSDRRSLTTKGGLITATRGLGFDLMSSDVNGVLSLITHRQNGTAKRVQRYLNGENIIYEIVADCTVSRGPVQALKIGTKSQNATQMSVSCKAPDHEFTNTYLVSGNGQIVQAQQWLSPFYGHAVIQRLR